MREFLIPILLAMAVGAIVGLVIVARRHDLPEPGDIPDWPCPDSKPHESHYWSDHLMGFECPGVRA